ncbi:uncharacterized protein [Asterias amurensis]|uniref:uncharacterized protein n=1 Tax=Asterias amurensis TaxID=7602 RepID=UPI003AB3CFAD
MADDKPVANHNGLNINSHPVENGVENGVDNENGDSNLLDFVTRSYHDQRVSGAAGDLSQADEERRNNFFQRAISESQRMSAEVDRSQQRQDALHAELGAANVHAWTMEHASQVIVTLPDHSQPHPSIPELQEPMECEK